MQSLLSRLQLILKFYRPTARAVSTTPTFLHITPVLKSLVSLSSKLNSESNIRLSLLPTKLKSNKPSYLNDLLHIQRNINTRSSDTVTFRRSSVCSCLKLTDRSLTHYAPVLWNSFPKRLCQLTPHHPSINQTGSTLALSSYQFNVKLKTFLFNRSFPA